VYFLLTLRVFMTERTQGTLYIVGGSILLLFTLDALIKLGIIVLGLWLIDRGLRLRGALPLFERIRLFIKTL